MVQNRTNEEVILVPADHCPPN